MTTTPTTEPAAPANRAYTQHRGSYPEAAWAALGEHTELSTAALADAIGCDPGSVHAIMAVPIKHGMLATTKREGLVYWRRGDHAPAPRPFDAEDDDEPLNGAPRANGKRPASSIFDLAMRQAAPAPAAKPVACRQAGTASDFRCGLYSDGQLVIERGAERITLERAQTEQLVRFLDRLALEEA